MASLAPSVFDLSLPSFEKRFITLNLDRLRRVHENLTPRQQDFLEILPLLFHLNHPLLPGYVAKDTPFGISDYSPSNASMRAAKRLSRSFEVDRRANRIEIAQAIESIFNVRVAAVKTMQVTGKTKQRGRITGKRRDWKKAIVKLMPGERIDFFEGV